MFSLLSLRFLGGGEKQVFTPYFCDSKKSETAFQKYIFQQQMAKKGTVLFVLPNKWQGETREAS